MNYLKIYISLIRKTENRNLNKNKAKRNNIYVEGHHVFPVSIFGKNKRVVYLTAREHYIAHALLEKIYIKRYGILDLRTKKMIYAFWRLNNETKQNTYRNSHLYEKSKLNFVELLKQDSAFNGEQNPAKNSNHREKLSKRMSRFLYSLSGEEYKEIYKNRIERTKIMFKGAGNPFYGKTHTEEVKKYIGQLSKETKWWNNGKENCKSKECPSEGWVSGMYYEINPNAGKKRKIEIVNKVRESNCKYIYIFISPEGDIIKSPYAKEICKKYDLNYGSALRVTRGERNHHKGWKISKVLREEDK